MVIWLGNFWYLGKLVAEEKWSLTRGGRNRRLTVLELKLPAHDAVVVVFFKLSGQHIPWGGGGGGDRHNNFWNSWGYNIISFKTAESNNTCFQKYFGLSEVKWGTVKTAWIQSTPVKALANEGHIVADTNVSPFARARKICCGHKKCFWFCSETFCVRNKCFPVCAAQETSWATMCPRLPGP